VLLHVPSVVCSRSRSRSRHLSLCCFIALYLCSTDLARSSTHTHPYNILAIPSFIDSLIRSFLSNYTHICNVDLSLLVLVYPFFSSEQSVSLSLSVCLSVAASSPFTSPSYHVVGAASLSLLFTLHCAGTVGALQLAASKLCPLSAHSSCQRGSFVCSTILLLTRIAIVCCCCSGIRKVRIPTCHVQAISNQQSAISNQRMMRERERTAARNADVPTRKRMVAYSARHCAEWPS